MCLSGKKIYKETTKAQSAQRRNLKLSVLSVLVVKNNESYIPNGRMRGDKIC